MKAVRSTYESGTTKLYPIHANRPTFHWQFSSINSHDSSVHDNVGIASPKVLWIKPHCAKPCGIFVIYSSQIETGMSNNTTAETRYFATDIWQSADLELLVVNVSSNSILNNKPIHCGSYCSCNDLTVSIAQLGAYVLNEWDQHSTFNARVYVLRNPLVIGFMYFKDLQLPNWPSWEFYGRISVKKCH